MIPENLYFHNVFLYGTNEKFNNTYRIRVTINDSVEREKLRNALDKASQRYPYFKVKVIKEENNLRIVENEAPFVITEGIKPVKLGTDEANRHFISAGFYDNVIWFVGYHMLTDGCGFFPFVKTTLYYYFCEKTNSILDPAGINTIEDAITEEETCDPLSRISRYPQEPFYVRQPKKIFHFPEKIGKGKYISFAIDEKKFMSFTRSKDGTPNATISAMLYKAIQKKHPENELTVSSGIEMNDRFAFGVSKSFINLISVIHLDYDNRVRDKDVFYLGTVGRGKIMLQSDAKNIQYHYGHHCTELNEKLSKLATNEEKKAVLGRNIEKIFQGDTFNVSYAGRSEVGCLEEFIKAIEIIANPYPGGMILEISHFKGKFYLCITQTFDEEYYVDTFIDMLLKAGIEILDYKNEELIVPEVEVF